MSKYLVETTGGSYEIETSELPTEKLPYGHTQLKPNEVFDAGLLKFLPGGKKFEKDMRQAQQEYYDANPGSLEVARKQDLTKKITGSIGAFIAGSGAAKEVLGLTKALALNPSAITQTAGRGLSGGLATAMFNREPVKEYPKSMLLGAAGEVAIPPVVSAVGKSIQAVGSTGARIGSNFTKNVKDAFGASNKIKVITDNLGQISADLEKFRTVSRPAAEGSFSEAVLRQTDKNKGLLNSLGDRITSTYGDAINLIESKVPVKATNADVLKLADDTLTDLSNSDLFDTEVSSNLQRIINRLKPEEGVIQIAPKEISLNELKNLKNEILGKFTKARSPESVAKSLFLKRYSSFLEPFGGQEVAALNSEFAPFIENFKQASRIFNPKGDDVVRGARALRGIAEGVGNPRDFSYIDNMNTLRSLEEGSGRFKGVGRNQLTGNFKSNLDAIEEIDNKIYELNKAKSPMKSEISRLENLRKLKNQALITSAAALLGGGAIGAGLKLGSRIALD